MNIESLFDEQTFTMTYVVYDEKTKDAVIIDPVLDFDLAGARLSRESVDKLMDFLQRNELCVHYILETHAHADHVTSSALLKRLLPNPQVAIGEKITDVQKTFSEIYNATDLDTDGSQFDRLLKEGEALQAGSLSFQVISTPGHTPACVSYLIEDAVFTGDSLMMPDFGTGRCDFPGGSAKDLYNSVHEKLYKLPDQTRVFVGHDYGPGGREIAWETSIAESKRENVRLKEETSEEEFVSVREGRDAKLGNPKLLLPSLQLNMRAGQLPPRENNGRHYLKLPLSFDFNEGL